MTHSQPSRMVHWIQRCGSEGYNRSGQDLLEGLQLFSRRVVVF